MKTYCVVITSSKVVEVQADSEERAIEAIKQRMDPRDVMAAEFQIAREASIEGTN